jgi:hypothetical protein
MASSQNPDYLTGSLEPKEPTIMSDLEEWSPEDIARFNDPDYGFDDDIKQIRRIVRKIKKIVRYALVLVFLFFVCHIFF